MDIRFTPAQARFIYLFQGFAPVATNIVTPFMVQRNLRDKPLSPGRKRDIVNQEIARQAVSCAIGLVFYFGGGKLTEKGLTKLIERYGESMGGAGRQIAMIVGASIAEFIGYAFVRPLVSTELIARWLHGGNVASSLRSQSDQTLSCTAAAKPVLPIVARMAMASRQPYNIEARQQQFFHNVQNRFSANPTLLPS